MDNSSVEAEIRALRRELKKRHEVGNMLAGYCRTIADRKDTSAAWKISLNKWLKAWGAIKSTPEDLSRG